MATSEEVVRILSPFFDGMRKMEAMLKCPVCNNFLEDPKLLSCDHIICRNCLPAVDGKRPTCPKCGKVRPKYARGSLYMKEMIKIFNEMDGAISDIFNKNSSDGASIYKVTETNTMPPVFKERSNVLVTKTSCKKDEASIFESAINNTCSEQKIDARTDSKRCNLDMFMLPTSSSCEVKTSVSASNGSFKKEGAEISRKKSVNAPCEMRSEISPVTSTASDSRLIKGIKALIEGFSIWAESDEEEIPIFWDNVNYPSPKSDEQPEGETETLSTEQLQDTPSNIDPPNASDTETPKVEKDKGKRVLMSAATPQPPPKKQKIISKQGESGISSSRKSSPIPLDPEDITAIMKGSNIGFSWREGYPPNYPDCVCMNIPGRAEVMKSEDRPENIGQYAVQAFHANQLPYMAHLQENLLPYIEQLTGSILEIGCLLSRIRDDYALREGKLEVPNLPLVATQTAKMAIELDECKDSVNRITQLHKEAVEENRGLREQLAAERQKVLVSDKSFTEVLKREEKMSAALKAREEEVLVLRENLKTEKEDYLQQFLGSEAFGGAAAHALEGIIKRCAYNFYEDFAHSYPLTPEHFGVRPISEEECHVKNLSDCSWDQDGDRFLGLTGEEIIPKVTYSDFFPCPRKFCRKEIPLPAKRLQIGVLKSAQPLDGQAEESTGTEKDPNGNGGASS